MLELNKNNLKEINYNDIVAMAIAESGAMGEPNGFYVVTKDMKQYHLNFQYTDIKKTGKNRNSIVKIINNNIEKI